MKNNESTIDVLNKLVEINNDRLEGYETALGETKENDLQTLFRQNMETSRKCKQELISEVTRLGGKPEEGTRNTGKFFRAWMDVKAALSTNDRKTVLSSCEYGEDHAVDTYEEVLKNNLDDLNTEQQRMVRNQYNLIKADHDTVKSLRDQVMAND